MDRFSRLQWIGRVTYYVGWIALVGGGLLQLNLGRALFTAINLSKRNLYEVGVACFLICIASEIRARESAGKEMSGVLKKAA